MKTFISILVWLSPVLAIFGMFLAAFQIAFSVETLQWAQLLIWFPLLVWSSWNFRNAFRNLLEYLDLRRYPKDRW